MTELSFLIDLLMNHKLSRATKQVVAERIKFVESIMGAKPQPYIPKGPPQAASTLALMAKHGDLAKDPMPVEVIAQTPETAAAMASRQQAIAESIAGKIDKVSGRPKKW